MIIYSHTLSPRLQYVVSFLSEYYNTPIKLIYDEAQYLAHPDGHKINYSYHRLLAEEVWIHSHVLLFETTVRAVRLDAFTQRGYTAFLKAEGDVGFDLMAAVFYLLSRYEEYLPHQKDSYGRFAHTASVAYKEGFLHLPLINIWLEDFRQVLQQKLALLQLSTNTFSFLPTYDIDMAWSYRHKGFVRNAGPVVRDVFTGRWQSVGQRLKVLRGKTPDPFDAYDWMDALHQRYNLQPIYFFLVAAKKGRLDKNIDLANPAFQSLIRRTADSYTTGLHPSWASGDAATFLTSEKGWLEGIAGKAVTASRQHFIRFTLPLSFRRLLALRITHDYSMGYGSINGFRASVATPFFWYDLKAESTTTLRLHPFCFMDANAFYEEKKTAEESLSEMLNYYETVRAVGGTMITIWHNSFLGTDAPAAGWREAYEMFVAKAAK